MGGLRLKDRKIMVFDVDKALKKVRKEMKDKSDHKAPISKDCDLPMKRYPLRIHSCKSFLRWETGR